MRKNIGILMQHWHRRGYLKQESLDDVIAIQRPQKMKSIFDLVIRENIVDIHLFKSYLPKKWMKSMSSPLPFSKKNCCNHGCSNSLF